MIKILFLQKFEVFFGFVYLILFKIVRVFKANMFYVWMQNLALSA